MAISNKGFETSGASAGYPDGWVIRSKSSLREIAGWTPGGVDLAGFPACPKPTEFNDAAWTKTNVTVTADNTAAVDGSVTADRLIDNAVNAKHIVRLAASRTWRAGKVYTIGFYGKTDDFPYAAPYVDFGAGGELYTVLDMTIGNAEEMFKPAGVASVSCEVVVLPNGWSRISMSMLIGAAPLTGAPGLIFVNSNLGTITYAGTSRHFFAWQFFTFEGVLLDADTFEEGWSANESYAVALAVGTNGVRAIWNDGTVNPSNFDGFEGGWGNTPYLLTIATAVQATFDTDTDADEDFENAWSANESYQLTIGSPVAATFDASPEAFEDFEEGWSSNESYSLVLTGPTTITFCADLAFGIETFERSIDDADYVVDAPTDVFTPTTQPYSNTDSVVLINVGGAFPGGIIHTLPHYVRDATGTTFKLSQTSGGAAIDVTDAGTGTQIVRADPRHWWAGPDFNPTI